MDSEFLNDINAGPSLDSFWFYIGRTTNLQIQVHFDQIENDVYSLSVERIYTGDNGMHGSFNEYDMQRLLHAITAIIELYTARFPNRKIRCEATDKIQEAIFRILLHANYDILSKLFTIQEEISEIRVGRNARKKSIRAVFLVERKSSANPTDFYMTQILKTQSALFGNTIEICVLPSPLLDLPQN